jgi:hypothetical protein
MLALIHNYSYHFLHTHDYPSWNRPIYWSKLPALSDLLHSNCIIAVAIDSDAIFKHLRIPGMASEPPCFTRHTSFTITLDNY